MYTYYCQLCICECSHVRTCTYMYTYSLTHCVRYTYMNVHMYMYMHVRRFPMCAWRRRSRRTYTPDWQTAASHIQVEHRGGPVGAASLTRGFQPPVCLVMSVHAEPGWMEYVMLSPLPFLLICTYLVVMQWVAIAPKILALMENCPSHYSLFSWCKAALGLVSSRLGTLAHGCGIHVS